MLKRSAAVCVALCLAAAGAWSKLPAPGPEEQAKADEAKAKAAEAKAKADELLARAQDRVVEKYLAEKKAKGMAEAPMPAKNP